MCSGETFRAIACSQMRSTVCHRGLTRLNQVPATTFVFVSILHRQNYRFRGFEKQIVHRRLRKPIFFSRMLMRAKSKVLSFVNTSIHQMMHCISQLRTHSKSKRRPQSGLRSNLLSPGITKVRTDLSLLIRQECPFSIEKH
jgi:hypothetical protein